MKGKPTAWEGGRQKTWSGRWRKNGRGGSGGTREGGMRVELGKRGGRGKRACGSWAGKGRDPAGTERPERGGAKQAERKVRGKKGAEGERGAPGGAR